MDRYSILGIFALTLSAYSEFTSAAPPAPRMQTLSHLPLAFEANRGQTDARPALERAASDDPEPLVRDAAAWALARLDSTS